ncbi:MAG: class I SAM-dependent methyltransferase [Thaumarchaeota archaeon]|nr:class I SAM-dependent methyltransferase [Nitrososphaerota archaeon]
MSMYFKGKKMGIVSKAEGTEHFGHGREIKEELAKRFPEEAARVLDVGTGFGSNLLFLKNIYPNSLVWSMDPSQDTLTNAERLLKEKGLNEGITLVKGNAEEMPFEDGFFDLVTSVMVLHHVVDVTASFREMYRVLSKDGTLLIADWKPEAHKLPFKEHHHEKDFISASRAEQIIKDVTTDVKISDWPLWYLLQARK